ncbi:YihY/virulence factor BrkB family protein [Bradyrhizobium sp. LHD-71]|uniref:YihY/virulence factor BrkB family protein n=1 Tax=Bradyrhizobium sp. LHD-71 TaxID=3072141 RepID=UPI00280E01B2|nr:YihY/virulence factor BrkB family protein [Bradyrhizobium sp. LHD-71]MDQ8730615.1 YihY/virulence factor BrkB family protein [Bradyrhizobium sp. LHD-71]
MKYVRYIYRVSIHALDMFLVDDGWAIASHIALSALMALFPFLIVLTALAGFFGSAELADQAAELIMDTWPDRVADAIAGEIHNVLTVAQGGVLTIGLILAIYFASNGVESLRVGLNRAYGVVEMRRWYWLRLESIGYTLLAAVVLLSLAFLIVLAPLLIATARRYFPIAMEINEPFIDFARLSLAILSLVVALFIVHKWLPAGTRRVRDIMPGILLTIVGSLASGILFGKYLEEFANNYVTTYAGLASVIIALVFLYFIASIFVYGGEFNAAIMKTRLPGGGANARPSQAPAPARAEKQVSG